MKINLITVPYDSGYYSERLGKGPQVLLKKVKPNLVSKGHDVRTAHLGIENIIFPTEIAASFEVNRNIANHVRESVMRGEFPVLFTGNCNTALGTLSGLPEKVGVVWIDCHGDFNTPETTVGGFLDGMALAMVTGRCWKNLINSVPGYNAVAEEEVVLIGARDLDPEEAINVQNSSIHVISSDVIRRRLISENFPLTGKIYLHLDTDILDPSWVKVNSYQTPGGLSPDDLYSIVKSIKEQCDIAAIAFTSYDPAYDPEGKLPPVIIRVLDIICSND